MNNRNEEVQNRLVDIIGRHSANFKDVISTSDFDELSSERSIYDLNSNGIFDWQCAINSLNEFEGSSPQQWKSSGLIAEDYAHRIQENVKSFFIMHSGSFPADLYSERMVIDNIKKFLDNGGVMLMFGSGLLTVDALTGKNELFELARGYKDRVYAFNLGKRYELHAQTSRTFVHFQKQHEEYQFTRNNVQYSNPVVVTHLTHSLFKEAIVQQRTRYVNIENYLKEFHCIPYSTHLLRKLIKDNKTKLPFSLTL